MRFALTVAAFAVGALAVPYKRDVATKYNVVYVTDVVTVANGQAKPTREAVPNFHYPHGHANEQPSTVEQVSTQAATEPKSSTPAPTSYQDICVYHHNIHRQNHSVSDVEWSDELASSAQQIADSCVYAHNTDVAGGGYGQNIAAGVEATNISAIITELFYNGEEPYFASQYGKDDPDMTNFELWGHFSQLVWRGTTHVGCSTKYCPDGLANVGSGVSPYFTVCNYKGPGNYAGEYGSNVLAPKGESSANWNTGLS